MHILMYHIDQLHIVFMSTIEDVMVTFTALAKIFIPCACVRGKAIGLSVLPSQKNR